MWLIAALCLLAQSARDPYRSAYRAWREAEPNLERDAAAAGDALAARSAHAAEQAAKYGAARASFLRELAGQQTQSTTWLETNLSNPKPISPAADELALIGSASSRLATSIATFANDPDRGIQQLRQALERERDALSALGGAVRERQSAEDRTAKAYAAIGEARQKAQQEYQAGLQALSSSAASLDKETEAWGTYYQKLSQAARGVAPAPLTTSLPSSAAAAAPAIVPRTPSITPLPLARYTGAWTYPTVGGMFHGVEPEFVDLVVHEENGHADGSFYARFKVPPEKTDPLIRFDFKGEFRNTRNQVFTLTTSDGATGTIELIPGNAFNLLEVNFQTSPVEGKIRAADLLLIKK